MNRQESGNPGARASATGAVEAGSFKTEEYRNRAGAATNLAHVIAAGHPKDAAILMDAALSDFSAGAPLPTFINEMSDAQWWASLATETQLKAYAVAAFEAMSPRSRQAFLRHVQGGPSA